MADRELETRILILERLVLTLLGGDTEQSPIGGEFGTRIEQYLRERAALLAQERRDFRDAVSALIYAQQESSSHLARAMAHLSDTFARGQTTAGFRGPSGPEILEEVDARLKEFRDAQERRNAELTRLFREFSDHSDQIEHLEQYLAGISLGLDISELPLHRYLPVRVYLRDDGPRSVHSVVGATSRFVALLGFEFVGDFDAETGSWFKGWRAASRDALTHPEMMRRLRKGERALELEYLHARQAEADKAQAEAAAALITAVKDQTHAVCQIGSILLIKRTDSDGRSSVVTRTLTQSEMIALEQRPAALKTPEDILVFLEGLATHGERPRLPS